MNTSSVSGPLEGFRIVEFAGIGPGPFCGRLFVELGAEVIVIDRPGPTLPRLDAWGKKSIIIDLRHEDAAETVLQLLESADALIEGNRPGVMERLGLGPEACHARNPKLVYGRMTGWGQDGKWASTAGHDINYLSITGALNAMGKAGDAPPPPLNLLGDFGGGTMFLAVGILSALLQAQKSGQGTVVDSAIVDGTTSLMGIIYGLHNMGLWSTTREDNMLDGGAPFYRCYKTADEKFMAVGAIEPQFFAAMLGILGISPEDYGGQNDKTQWPAQHSLLEQTFAQKTRDDWAALFDGSDACVTPVLDYLEAVTHPHNQSRSLHQQRDNKVFTASAPRFSGHETGHSSDTPEKGIDTVTILREAGFSQSMIDGLLQENIVVQS
jgi:alpha-methylacyl-CoA racemase